ncbi:MAG: hypothetical protein H6623_03635 [Bdellovibrionaceae bacterium]|nr:hypothetical protein [Pseudobdellovibrionaceae bacterium]
METWLPLNDYANRYQLSVSTVRRRIKSKKVKFKLDEGKYYILDSMTGQEKSVNTQPRAATQTNPTIVSSAINHEASALPMKLLLDELKRAYLDSLQSKEDQILHLKQQVSDLKTLVMCLEKENSRAKGLL